MSYSENQHGRIQLEQIEDPPKIAVLDVDSDNTHKQKEHEWNNGVTYGSFAVRKNVQDIDKSENSNAVDAKPDNDSNLPARQFTFSVIRVWVAVTLIVTVYVVVLITTGPLISQYLVKRIAEDSYNLTANSTSNKGACAANSSGGDHDAMNKAQKEASSTLMYSTIASTIPAFFTCLFAGSFSDFMGRKLILLLSLSGAMIKIVLLCFIIYFKLDIQLIYIGAALDGVSGSYFVLTMAASAVITDVTPEPQNKAVRFAIIEGIILVGGALSQLGTGYLIKGVGFFVPALIAACCLVFAFLITIFLLPETIRDRRNFTWNIGTHIKNTFSFYYTKRIEKSRRIQFALGLIVHVLMMSTNTGKAVIETIYVMNRPICWESMDIGIFNSTKMIVMSLTAVAVFKVCKNRLSLEITGMICLISSAAGFILEGFADSTLLMYMSAVVGILYTAIIPLPRALLSQIASAKEQGALFSGLSCIETVASLVSNTVFTLIYNASLGTFRGAVFMVIAAICVINIAFLGAFRYLRISYPASSEYLIDNEATTEKDKNTSSLA